MIASTLPDLSGMVRTRNGARNQQSPSVFSGGLCYLGSNNGRTLHQGGWGTVAVVGHCELVAKKWDHSENRKAIGRPRIRKVIVDSIVRFAKENPTWGYDRIQGALANVGYHISDSTVANLLKPENKKTLQAILTYHVVPGKVTTGQVVKLSSAKTLQGQEVAIAVSKSGVTIDDANVVKTDIACSNGIIHVVDAVILPNDGTAAGSF